jgi:hypothetical protein
MTRWRRARNFSIFAVLYFIASLVLVAATSGMAEGSSIPFALIGSPVTAVLDGGLLLVPVPGLVFGALLAVNRRRLAGGFLVLHYVCVPIAIGHQAYLSVQHEYEKLLATPGAVPVLFLSYVISNVFAWMTILRDRSLKPELN